ncbi:MAG: hypothetical protein JWN72_533 [Thermoleophilia bacterium]|nr:hypothetical protein [Thermoleophilia bacterium]
MRRILPIAALFALVFGTLAGVAWANADTPAHDRAAATAPLRVPATVPVADATQPGAAGYRSSAAIAATITGAEPAASKAPAAEGGTTITVTATVLPTVSLQLDASGDLRSIVTNTPDRDARNVLFAAHRPDGSTAPITAELWRDARAALARARAGAGTVWTR